ncbi:hypothetical protein P7C73_g1881, partial [Tremellales sp. Uapishka_1]
MTTPQQSMSAAKPETYMSHGWEKCKKQPLVPLGILATCAALIGATSSLRTGNRAQFNKYLRYRVIAQGVTVVAAVAGTLLMTNKAEEMKGSRDRVLRGELPLDPTSISLRKPETTPSVPVDFTPAVEDSSMYPPREKIKVSEFARRLREAEGLQKEQDDGRKRR